LEEVRTHYRRRDAEVVAAAAAARVVRLPVRRVVRPSPQALPSLRRSPAGPHLLSLAVQQAPSLATAPETARL